MTLASLIARDGAVCVWCGRESWHRDLTIEHLLPKTRGGRGHDENLAVACRRCNRRRGARPVAAFVRDQLAAGGPLAPALLAEALERLAGSEFRPHADYGARQLALLQRIAAGSGAR